MERGAGRVPDEKTIKNQRIIKFGNEKKKIGGLSNLSVSMF